MKLRLTSLLLSLLPATLHAQYYLRDATPQPPAAAEWLAFDINRGRTVAFLGTSTWEHDGSAWRQVVTPQSPPDRYEYAMVFDGARVLVYGGQSTGPGALGDFWAFDGTNWTALPMTGANPGLRRGHGMAWDSIRNRVVLYGGTDMNSGFPADTWEWDGTAWTQIGGQSPGSRVWHRMVFDPTRQRVVMCGGAMNPFVFQDTWEYDGNGWTQIGNNLPAPRMNAVMVFHQGLNKPVLLGGWDGNAVADTFLVYDAATTSWTDLVSSNGHGFPQVFGGAYDPTRQRTVLLTREPTIGFGGEVETLYHFTSGSLTASYAAVGAGCAVGGGRVPVPRLSNLDGSLPARGVSFGIEVSALTTASHALIATGSSNTTWAGTPLPLNLGPLGLPGCFLRSSMQVLAVVPVDPNTFAARWSLPIPTHAALAGVRFYQQAVALDPTAPLGIAGLSEARMAVIQ